MPLVTGRALPGVKGSCWRCEYWSGDIIANCHCTCIRNFPRLKIAAIPMEGCAFWSLSPGLDGMTDQEADAAVRTPRAVSTAE